MKLELRPWIERYMMRQSAYAIDTAFTLAHSRLPYRMLTHYPVNGRPHSGQVVLSVTSRRRYSARLKQGKMQVGNYQNRCI